MTSSAREKHNNQKNHKGGFMNQILDVLNVSTWVDKDGKKQRYFTRCGSAFPRKNDKGFILKLDIQNMTGNYLLTPKKQKRSL